MAQMVFDEDYLREEPCLSCDKPYIEDIWNEWCCDEKVCPYKVKSEDNCMKEIQEIEVKTTIYVTDDGEKFDNLKLAQRHERHIKALEKLNSFKIDGPNYTPFDEYRLLSYNWQWYKVHNQHELNEILRLFAEVYTMQKCSDDDDFDELECRFYNEFYQMYVFSGNDLTREQRAKFPKYICISFNHRNISTLDNFKNQYEREMEKWEKFYQPFKNDLKKDIENL